MPKEQAAAVRAKWKQRVDSIPCTHLNQELEHSDNGYVTGNYHCMVCGEVGACTPQASVSHEATTCRELIRLLPKGMK
jgi:hypothetical protein